MAGLDLQLKVRQNAEELGDFLKDLDRWETDIKKKDEELKSSKTVMKRDLPPVRNQRRKKKTKKKEEKSSKNVTDPKRIGSYDYNAWDRFDVDDELKKLDEEDEMETLTSSDEESTDEEQIEEERRLQKSLLEKDKGNDLFKEGKYEEAINRYTTAIQLDPSNAVLPANRAMALLKVQRYGAAEEDCNTAIMLDASYTKAYLRRGAARAYLGKLKESLDDYEQALKLEPENKQAKQEIAKLKQTLENGKVPTSNKDSQDAEQGKQKKPFKRIQIDEIGSDSSDEEPSEHKSLRTRNCGVTEKTGDEFDETERNEEKPRENGVHRIIETLSSSEPEISSSSEKPKEQVHENKQQSTSSTSAVQKNTNIKKKIFEIPKTSIQLEKDWRELKSSPDQLFDYFRKINPKSYQKLFQQAIDSDMLSAIIAILHDYYVPANLPVYNELECLAQVKRFGMAAMFLSAQDKEALQNLFSYIKDNKSDTSCPSESQVAGVLKKYCL